MKEEKSAERLNWPVFERSHQLRIILLNKNRMKLIGIEVIMNV